MKLKKHKTMQKRHSVVRVTEHGVRATHSKLRLTETLPFTICDLLLIIALHSLRPLWQNNERRVLEIIFDFARLFPLRFV